MEETKKPKKYAIHFGANQTDTEHYDDNYALKFPEASSKIMNSIFDTMGFTSEVFTGTNTTSTLLKNKMSYFANVLTKGDTIVLSFCGHTTQINPKTDISNAYREDKGWMMYDRILFYPEIWQIVKKFKSGVKVVIITDSCYSDDIGFDPTSSASKRTLPSPTQPLPSYLKKNKWLYNILLEHIEDVPREEIAAALVIIGATDATSKTYEHNKQTDRTYFSLAFQEAYEHLLEGDTSLITWPNLFEDTCWVLTTRKIEREITSGIPADASAETIRKTLKTVFGARSKSIDKLLPRWHYYRGHEYTDLRTESINKPKN